MRACLYYYFHSFINQIKKLFKSWILIFCVALFAFIMLIGVVASTFDSSDEDQKEDIEISTMIEDEDQKEETEISTMIKDELMAQSPEALAKKAGINNMTELVMGGIIFLIFALNISVAQKNTGRLFQPADVNLLFPSPMRPQSVILFRIGTTIGSNLFLIFFALFQLPNLIVNVGLSVWGAVAAMLIYIIANILSTFIQLLVYMLSLKYRTFRKVFAPGCVVFLAMIFGGFLLYQKNTGLDTLDAANGYFNSPISRYIPFWGWSKGFVRAAVEGNNLGCLIFFALIIVGSALLIWIIYSLNADFYEDAMTKSEEVAALREAMSSDRTNMVKRKKDRSEKLLRDGLKHGFGANVYFYKNMYNRFRFAHFGFFTKTMIFYITVAVAYSTMLVTTKSTSNLNVLAILFAVMAFYRSMGNVVAADTHMDYFVMIPESAMKKIFFSYLAELTGTAIDLAVPMVIGSLIMGANPLLALCYLVPILSMNTYAASIGTFIDVTVPANAGTNLKQVVQVMFAYFGLAPDLIIIAIFAFLNMTFAGFVICSIFNFALGLFIFFLSALFLEPHGGSKVRS